MPSPIPPPQLDLRQRFGAMRNLPPFLREIWASSPWLTTASLALRLVRALMPVATLYVGKLIIDEAVRLVGAHVPHDTLATAWQSGELSHLVQLLLLEFGLAIASDLFGRAVAYVDSVLSEKFSNEASCWCRSWDVFQQNIRALSKLRDNR